MKRIEFPVIYHHTNQSIKFPLSRDDDTLPSEYFHPSQLDGGDLNDQLTQDLNTAPSPLSSSDQNLQSRYFQPSIINPQPNMGGYNQLTQPILNTAPSPLSSNDQNLQPWYPQPYFSFTYPQLNTGDFGSQPRQLIQYNSTFNPDPYLFSSNQNLQSGYSQSYSSVPNFQPYTGRTQPTQSTQPSSIYMVPDGLYNNQFNGNLPYPQHHPGNWETQSTQSISPFPNTSRPSDSFNPTYGANSRYPKTDLPLFTDTHDPFSNPVIELDLSSNDQNPQSRYYPQHYSSFTNPQYSPVYWGIQPTQSIPPFPNTNRPSDSFNPTYGANSGYPKTDLPLFTDTHDPFSKYDSPNQTAPIIDLTAFDDKLEEVVVRKPKKLKQNEILPSNSKSTTHPYKTLQVYNHWNIPAITIGKGRYLAYQIIPKGIKIVVLEQGASANIVRLLPTEIKLIILNPGLTQEIINAIPQHITILQIYPTISGESPISIPPHITKVLACNFTREDLEKPNLDQIKPLMIHLPDLLSEREAFYKEHLDIV